MNLQDEIAKVAHELYERSGCIPGRDEENWLEAERIVMARHASQEIEEPEGEGTGIESDVTLQEVEESKPVGKALDIEDESTVMEESEANTPQTAKKRTRKASGPAAKAKTAKSATTVKKAPAGTKTSRGKKK